MAKLTPADLIKPTPPGVSWTAPAKGRPWSQPPKFVDLGAVAQMYVDKMSDPAMMNNLIDSVETQIPLASIAEGLMLNGVQKGMHTIDVGILVMPVIIEMLVATAEIHGVDYIVFPDDLTEDDLVVPERVVSMALKNMDKKQEMPENVDVPKVELSGLMARKPKQENM